MSRLEPNAEPSMEEILASIRRIIAEEPAGSRPKPPSPRADSSLTPSSSPQRGFMSREAFMRSSQPVEPEANEPQFSTPVSSSPAEPAADAGSRNGASSSVSHNHNYAGGASSSARSSRLFATEPAPTSRASDVNSDLRSDPGAGRSTDLASVDEIAEVTEVEATVVSSAELQSDGSSIDAQLARLLDDDLSNALREAEGSLAASSDDDAADADADAPITDVRATFPASRAGYTNGASEAHDSSDPFAFDLGPSPFQKSPPEKPAPEKSAPEPIAIDRRPVPTAEAVEPTRADNGIGSGTGYGGRTYVNGAAATPVAVQPVTSSAPTVQSASVSAKPFAASPIFATPEPVAMPAPVSASTQAPSSSQPASAVPRQGTPFAVPSVAATLGPYRSLEPLSESFRQASEDRGRYSAPPAAAGNSTPTDTSRNVLSHTDARRERFDRLDPTLPDTIPLSSSAVPTPGETSADRAMEDAVADLLRPLLKTWLAENMPKIVERALRREITERLLPPSSKNNSD